MTLNSVVDDHRERSTRERRAGHGGRGRAGPLPCERARASRARRQERRSRSPTPRLHRPVRAPGPPRSDERVEIGEVQRPGGGDEIDRARGDRQRLGRGHQRTPRRRPTACAAAIIAGAGSIPMRRVREVAQRDGRHARAAADVERDRRPGPRTRRVAAARRAIEVRVDRRAVVGVARGERGRGEQLRGPGHRDARYRRCAGSAAGDLEPQLGPGQRGLAPRRRRRRRAAPPRPAPWRSRPARRRSARGARRRRRAPITRSWLTSTKPPCTAAA